MTFRRSDARTIKLHVNVLTFAVYPTAIRFQLSTYPPSDSARARISPAAAMGSDAASDNDAAESTLERMVSDNLASGVSPTGDGPTEFSRRSDGSPKVAA